MPSGGCGCGSRCSGSSRCASRSSSRIKNGCSTATLQPTNLLVALSDGQPVPEVIDFGIAKAIGQPLTERTRFTHFGPLVGMPQ